MICIKRKNYLHVYVNEFNIPSHVDILSCCWHYKMEKERWMFFYMSGL